MTNKEIKISVKNNQMIVDISKETNAIELIDAFINNLVFKTIVKAVFLSFKENRNVVDKLSELNKEIVDTLQGLNNFDEAEHLKEIDGVVIKIGESISFSKELSSITVLWFLFVSIISAHDSNNSEEENRAKASENLNNLVKTILLSINRQMFGENTKEGDENGEKK